MAKIDRKSKSTPELLAVKRSQTRSIGRRADSCNTRLPRNTESAFDVTRIPWGGYLPLSSPDIPARAQDPYAWLVVSYGDGRQLPDSGYPLAGGCQLAVVLGAVQLVGDLACVVSLDAHRVVLLSGHGRPGL